MMIALDQYGHAHKIPGKHPRKELMELMGCKHAAKMYRDKLNGSTVHTGYVISGLWLELYTPMQKEA